MATASGSSSGNELGYTGREDDGTGLNYYRARYYHPGLQRFISEDSPGRHESLRVREERSCHVF
jgi:RHS repeat-associated protein